MSMTAILEPVATEPLQQTLHHDLSALAVERADQRQRQHAFPQLHDRRRELDQLFLLTRDELLARLLKDFRSYTGRAHRAGLVASQRVPAIAGRLVPEASVVRLNSACFREKTNVATCDGVKPCVARLRDSSLRKSRTSAH
jgi:hypothetical protein